VVAGLGNVPSRPEGECEVDPQASLSVGYANVTGRTVEAFAHLRRVTGMDDAQARAHVHAAENLWIERSARTWTLDLAMLTGAGITVRRPEH